MNKLILIKYGELFTKKGNRNLFISSLYQDLKNKLMHLECKVNKEYLRMNIEYHDYDEKEIITALDHTFGIHSYSIANKVETTSKVIMEKSLEILLNKKFSTFKVEVSRANKKFEYNSMEFMREVGGYILMNIPNLKVDLHNPEIVLKIEIVNDFSYIYTKKESGLGGYPLNTLGRGLLMLSGGIDSPVAGFLAQKRGLKISGIYFEAIPHTSIEARNKVLALAKELAKYGSDIDVHIINFTKLQEEIYKVSDPSYVITIMRRMMYRISEQVAKRNNDLVLLNGESMGQVASQTLESMSVINNVTNMPVLRPVVAMDKLEIISIAKKINTYETSILPFEDCCTIFVPKNPVIKPNLERCEKIEERINYSEFIEEIMNNIETIKVSAKLNNKYEDIL